MRLVAVALLFATALTAQRGGMGGARHGGFGGGGGFAGHRPVMGGGFRGGGGFNHVPSRPFPSHLPSRPVFGFSGGRTFRSGSFYGYPYGYPYGGLWTSPFYYSPYDWYSSAFYTSPSMYSGYSGWNDYRYGTAPYSSGPNIIVVPPLPSTSPAPSDYGVEPYQPAPQPERAQTPPPLATKSWAYLIATRDGTIWLAREYRVENGTVRFLTTGNIWKDVPLADVDRQLTEQLNRERGVAVDLR